MYAGWEETKEKEEKEAEETVVSEEEGDDDEDVLAVTDNKFLNLSEFIKEEYSTADDDLAVYESYYGDVGLKDEVASDDSNDWNEANNWSKLNSLKEINKTNEIERTSRSCKQNNSTPSSDVPIERLKALEEGLEQVKQVVVSLYSRSNCLEKKTDEFGKNFEKLGVDVQALSTQISVFDINAWNVRLDDQAEGLAIIRERIVGIERKGNEEIEKNDRRLDDLEENFDKYKIVNSDVVTKVNALETTIQSLESSVRSWISISDQVNLLQRKQETFVAETNGLSSLKKNFGNLERRLQAFQTRFDSFEKATNNADFIYESRLVKLENASNSSASVESPFFNDALGRIQNLQRDVERIDSSLASLSNLEKIVAKLQSEPWPSEARVKNLEAVSEEFKSSIKGQGQFFLEQTQNLTSSIRSHASDLSEQLEQTQAKVQSLDACVRQLEEESMSTTVIGRMNRLLAEIQEQNKEQKEENRRFQAYVDEQRQAMEKLVKEIEQKTALFVNQETYMADKETNENSSKQSRGFWGNIFGGGRDPNEEKS